MKNNSKEVGKKIYDICYNDYTKSFVIMGFDVVLVNEYGVYFSTNNEIESVSFDSIAEYKDRSAFVENCVKTKLLDYFLGTHRCGVVYLMSFIHKENAEEFVETHQYLLNVKDLSLDYDKIKDKFKFSGLQQLTDLNETVRSIVRSEEMYNTDSIKDFLYTYISDVVDVCKALATKTVEE